MFFIVDNTNFDISFSLKYLIYLSELHNIVFNFLILSTIIYFLGIFGIVLNRRNFLITMLFIEVMYVGIFLFLIGSAMYLNTPLGQIYALMILVTAACESAVGLGILLVLFKNDNSIEFLQFTELRG
jgi:NADH-quinone oxidoreductase subunit K